MNEDNQVKLVHDYMDKHPTLEEDFIRGLPLEDQPLDDDTPDYIQNNYELFFDYVCQRME